MNIRGKNPRRVLVHVALDTKAEQETMIEHNFLLVQDGQDVNLTRLFFLLSFQSLLAFALQTSTTKLPAQNVEWKGV